MEDKSPQLHPLTLGMIFQGCLIPLALILAYPAGIDLWAALHFSLDTLLLGLAATIVMIGVFVLLIPFRFAWARKLERRVKEMLATLFEGKSVFWALPISLLAGFGEEMLFRGVVQTVLGDWLGLPTGLLLSALLFGLVHYISTPYFLLATGMGLYMGLLYLWSDNLLLPIVVHALYDWIVIHYYLRRQRAVAVS